MAIYLVKNGNEHALSMVEKILKAEGNSYVLCSQLELDTLNDGAVVTLPNKVEIEGNSALLEEYKALGINSTPYATFDDEPKKIPRSHFIDAANEDMVRGIDTRSSNSSVQMLMRNFISEEK